MDTSVGYDANGFGLRERSGEFMHMARRKPYRDKFGAGDVIGCRIALPELQVAESKAVDEAEERAASPVCRLWSRAGPDDSGIDITDRANVEFFKNSVSMGIPPLFSAHKPVAPAKRVATLKEIAGMASRRAWKGISKRQ